MSLANGGFEIASNDSVTIVYDYNSQGRVDSLSPGRMLVADNVGEFTSTGFGDFYVDQDHHHNRVYQPNPSTNRPQTITASIFGGVSTISRSSGITGYGRAAGLKLDQNGQVIADGSHEQTLDLSAIAASKTHR
jgi:hypothetical protein